MKSNQNIKLKNFLRHTNKVPTIFKEFSILEIPSKCTENMVKSHEIVE